MDQVTKHAPCKYASDNKERLTTEEHSTTAPLNNNSRLTPTIYYKHRHTKRRQEVVELCVTPSENDRWGSLSMNCRNKRPTTGSNQLPVTVVCHACGEKGHYTNQCRKTNINAQGRAYMLKDRIAQQDTKNPFYDIEMASTNTVIKGLHLTPAKSNLEIESHAIKLGSSDVVIGMDWLSKYHAKILCDEKFVYIPINGETLIISAVMSTDDASSVVTYTSISSNSDGPSWDIPLMDTNELLEMDPYEEIPIEDQPLPNDASPIVLSPGYIADSDPKEDPNEDPEEDPADYLADEGDDDDDESSDNDDKGQEALEEDEEEEENLAPADSSAILAIDPTPIPFPSKAEVARLLALPTPPPSLLTPLSSPLPQIPPPPTSPTYAQAPLGTRAAMMRAASPPTHHPLPLPAPPTPLPLPSTTRRADISKADMPPRKRLMLTAPTPRCKIRESSATAAARQSGSFMAHRVDYNFVDTVEASVRVTEPKAMVAIEMVNLRVSYQENVHRRESEEFYTRHQDAQDDRAAVRAEIETQLYHREWQHRDADDCVTRHIMRTQKMPPKRTVATTTPTTDAQIKALIAQGVADALAERDADRFRNGDDSHDSGSDGRRRMPIAREYTYTDFLKCQPLNFKGTKGVVGLTQWTVEHDVAYAMPWKTLKKMMTDKYCPMGEIKKLEIEMWNLKSDEVEKYVGGQPDMIHSSVMVSKPKTMQDAIEFATKLMWPGEKKPYRGSKPLCPKCNYHHDGRCTPKFTNYKKVGHSARDYRSRAATINNQRDQGANQRAGNGNVVARAYAVGTIGTNPNSNVVTGTFLLNNQYASILFDTGANRSFMSISFGSLIDIIPTTLDYGVDFRRRPTTKGVRLRVADSHTGNHLKDGFTPLKTIRRLLVVIGRRSYSGFKGEAFEPERRVHHQAPQSNVMYTSMYVLLSTIIHEKDRRPCSKLHMLNSETHLPLVMSAKDTIAVQHCGLSAKELNEFLSFYPIPSEYDVILPKSTQTIFDAPPGYVGLYTHSFSLANLSFFNLCRAGSWLTFQKRSEKHIPNLLPKVITHIEGWHKRFFFVQDSIFSSKYPQLLLDENKLNLKSFKDKLPPNIDENPYFQRLGRYPISVRVFDDPILFLVGLKPSWEFGQQRHAIIMAFRNFIYTKDDYDLAFLPKEPFLGFGTDLGESPKAGMFIVHPRSVAARIKERKCKMRGGSSRPLMKRKLASGSSSSRVVRAKNSASKDDAPILSISDDDEGLPDCFELKDANACHLKIFTITPPAWKVKRRAREFLQVIEKMRGEADVIKARERSREEECKELRVKCEAAMAEFDKNPVVLALREKISSMTADVKEHKGSLYRMMLESQKWEGYQVTLSTLDLKVDSLEVEKARLEAVEASLCREVEELKQDIRDVVSKVVPYAAIELVHSDELGRLVGTLVSSAITYGHCRAYEQVVVLKEPFDLSKAKGYHSSYKKEHTQASNDFATTTFPWLDEFVSDATAPIEALLSKKPPALQKPAPSRTQMPMPSSQKATPSSNLSSNPMSSLADLVKPSPSPFK
ncbi:putative reverse transcriptase domain-containing protein [Tanacetum coccineum]|uniref:Reverse transcriptase domain-containing protein n=1 Tax=Tanacetum coccineum TaxID=301880 RepID=A0ABQ5DJE3_9ASTR